MRKLIPLAATAFLLSAGAALAMECCKDCCKEAKAECCHKHEGHEQPQPSDQKSPSK